MSHAEWSMNYWISAMISAISCSTPGRAEYCAFLAAKYGKIVLMERTWRNRNV